MASGYDTSEHVVARARDSAGLHLLDIYRERCAMGRTRSLIASLIHTGCVQYLSHIPIRVLYAFLLFPIHP